MSTVLQVSTNSGEMSADADKRAHLAASLAGVLADSHVLMVKTQGVHWNMTGPLFLSVHQLTQEHYEDLFAAIDEIAERMRAIGYPAPSSVSSLVSMSEIQGDVDGLGAERMLVTLIADHETVVRRLEAAVELAEELRDVGSADLLTERLRFHEKAIWMLRATASS